MQVVLSGDCRVTATPNATMTTLASPTLGTADGCLWWVEMGPGAEGPEHAFAGEVIWAITRGSATLRVAGQEHVLAPGDTAVLPGGEMRRVAAGPEGFTAIVSSGAPTEVSRADGLPAGVPAWVS